MEKLQSVRIGKLDAPVGAFSPFRANRNGQLVVANHMRDAAEAGRLYSVANQAAVATTAALATTWTGLGISNPSGSGKNAVLWEFGAALSVAGSDDGVLGLMTSDTTGYADNLTAKLAMNASGPASALYCDDGATIATPILERVFDAYGAGATNLGYVGHSVYPINGSIILPPGRSVMTYTTTATTAAFVFHFVWEEVDV